MVIKRPSSVNWVCNGYASAPPGISHLHLLHKACSRVTKDQKKKKKKKKKRWTQDLKDRTSTQMEAQLHNPTQTCVRGEFSPVPCKSLQHKQCQQTECISDSSYFVWANDSGGFLWRIVGTWIFTEVFPSLFSCPSHPTQEIYKFPLSVII